MARTPPSAGTLVVPALAALLLLLSTFAFSAIPQRPTSPSRVPADELGVARMSPSAPDERPASPAVMDYGRTIDVNDLRMFVTNFGEIAFDVAGGAAGLEYPKGSGKTAMFAAGLWLGAHVNAETRVTVAEYSWEYGPGAMVGGQSDFHDRPEYEVYKLNRVNPDMAALADYTAGAVPHGAPPVSVLPDGTLDITGDQMLWSVFNDADLGLHTARPGGTAPLGVEVRQTTFAYDDPGPLGRVVFLKYEILNQGSNLLQDLLVSLWSDPDVGGPNDDLVSCDPVQGLGLAYNATNNDLTYGFDPPAVGFDLLYGATAPGGGGGGLRSFVKFVNGTDPTSAAESYNWMSGHFPDGSPIIDPTTGLPTNYMVWGNPIAGTGWIDSGPADRRMMLTSGPLTLAPGQSTEVVFALIVGQGADRLGSVARLVCDDQEIQAFFDRGLAPPLPVTQPCTQLVNCPRTADYWRDQCAGAGDFSLQALQTIAHRADTTSTYFDWSLSPVDDLCAAVGGTADTPRRQAEQEFTALLANVVASSVPPPASGLPVFLNPGTPIACDGLAANTIAELTSAAAPQANGGYLDHVATNPTPIEGVDWGGGAFGGGAGVGWDFLGSSIDPNVAPDSFPRVELRFDHSQTQKAYRFLRLETPGGGFPQFYPGGRGYLFGGMRDVSFTCWDVDHNVQLDVGFVERTIVDDFGTIQPPASQVATFDSTWSPDDSQYGGREYLVVYSRPYSPVAKPELAQDGGLLLGSEPVLYGLWCRRLSAGTVFDDGDAFEFAWGVPFGPSVDALMIRLAELPPAEAAPTYLAIAACLSDINHGVGIGPTCDQPTAALVSLMRADAAPDRVSLAWYASEPIEAAIERRVDGGEWQVLAARRSDGAGRIAYEDLDVSPGHRYGYRLRVTADGVTLVAGETSVEVPATAILRLTGFVPNPGRGAVGIGFSLAGRGPATLEVFDVAGRRVRALEVGALGPGPHVVPLVSHDLPSGVYLLRLTQGGRSEISRSAMID
jgi:hypothetical protein